MTFFKTYLLCLLAFGFMVLTSVLLYSGLPLELPSHYNIRGEADRYSSRAVVASLLPTIYLLLLVVVDVALRISPRQYSMPNSKRAVAMVLFGAGIMFAFIHMGFLVSPGDFDFFVRQLAFGTAGFLIVTGNVFGKTERNFFIGLRIPWTIASVSNWKATHRFAGWLMVSCGVLLLAINLVYSNIWLIIVAIFIPVILPIIYSIAYFFRYERDDLEPED